MVSAVEQKAANTSWSALGKAKDLRNRILFTLGLLCVYRLGTFIPVQRDKRSKVQVGCSHKRLRRWTDAVVSKITKAWL